MMQIKQTDEIHWLLDSLSLSLTHSLSLSPTHAHTQMHRHTIKQDTLMASACLSGNWKSRHWWSGWLPDPSACQPVGTALWYWKHRRSSQWAAWRFGVSNLFYGLSRFDMGIHNDNTSLDRPKDGSTFPHFVLPVFHGHFTSEIQIPVLSDHF